MDPNDHLVYYYLAFYYACLAKVPEATVKVRQALTLNPEHTPSLQLAILLLSAQKKMNEAKALLESSLEDFPDHIGLLFIKARVELQTEAFDVINTCKYIYITNNNVGFFSIYEGCASNSQTYSLHVQSFSKQ